MSEKRDNAKSINLFGGSGTLKEINLTLLEDQEVELKNGKTIKCSKMAKADFKQPMFVIEVNGKDYKMDMFAAAERTLNKDKEEIDNPRFKELQTMMNTYVPKSKETPENPATRVRFRGNLRDNVYVKNNEAHEGWQWGLSNLSSNNAEAEDSFKGELTGIIQSFEPEYKTVGEKEEETGRFKMSFYYLDWQLNACPITIMMPEEYVEVISEMWGEGDSCHVYYEPGFITVGNTAKEPSKGGFGKRESVSTGFDIPEIVIIGGDPKFNEEEELFIPVEDMEGLLEAREIMKEQKVEDAKKKEKEKAKGGSSAKGGKAAEKKSPKSFGTKTSFKKSETTADDDDCPFM